MNKRSSELSSREKRTIALLGLPSFGLALGVTVVVTYVPLIARQYTSSTTVVGSIIAVEGLIALFLPVLAGTWSDHLRTRYGGRLPFLMVGMPLATIMLLVVGLAASLAELIICLAVFFIAYYLAYEPYRALYPDLIEKDVAARAQSIQALWRGAGTGVALVAGGFLFAATNWLPFAVSAFFVVLSSGMFLWVLLKYRGVPKQEHRQSESIKSSYQNAIKLLKTNKKLQYFVIANSFWELSLAALKTFILLYLTAGLGKSKTMAAVFISVTAIVVFIAAPFAGKLGDKIGKVKVARIAAFVFGACLLAPLITTAPYVLLPILPIAAIGGAIVLTLPYAILMPLMPEDQHGKLTGIYSTSRGIGLMLGPLLTGVLVTHTKNLLPSKGYSVMWLVCALAMLLSVIPLSNLSSRKAE